ncbi:MAG TPA: signal peptidase I [Lachnospiraceae bacterium]|nr:signal peptidase I [Lachnospiraceae bacterium]
MRNEKPILKEIGSWIVVIVVALVLSLFIDSTIIAKAEVEQSSMENTLFEGQQLIVNKLSYTFDEPKRGDIIIFLENEEKGNIIDNFIRSVKNRFSSSDEIAAEQERLVKRVIGVAGDEIDIQNGYVYINGERLEESYVNGITLPGNLKLPITVGEGELFVIGDNREVSRDSRDFGPIDVKQVEGKAVFRVYPFNQIGKVE